MNTDKNLTKERQGNDTATSTVCQQSTEGFILVPHTFPYITTLQKKCHYMFLPVLLTFQPSMAWPDVVFKGCKQHNCLLSMFPITFTTTFTFKRHYDMQIHTVVIQA